MSSATFTPVPATYANPGAPYQVTYGYGDYQRFDSFVAALKFHAETRDSSLYGHDVDFDCQGDPLEYVMCSDGLTEEEREWIEAVEGGERPWE